MGNYYDCRMIEIIQDHKERFGRPLPREIAAQPAVCRETATEVVDLDKKITTHIDYATRSYYQEPFPTPMEVVIGRGFNGLNIGELKPTGRRKKIAGYWCEEYSGIGNSTHWGRSTETDCISREVPGEAEYDDFAELLEKLYMAAGYGVVSPYETSGVALQTITDCCGGPAGWVVTKIRTMRIPAKVFEPPAGFVKRQHP